MKMNILAVLFLVGIGAIVGFAFSESKHPAIQTNHSQSPQLGQVVPAVMKAPSSRLIEDNIKTDYTYPQFYTITTNYNNNTLVMATISNTNSMIPTFDKNSKVIYTKYFTKNNLNVGDIIIYFNGGFYSADIIHRIVEKGNDEQGWYVITRGDANKVNDPKIRFENIKGVVIMIIY